MNRTDRLLRLNKYLDHVRKNVSTSIGELKEFWVREERKTQSRISKI